MARILVKDPQYNEKIFDAVQAAARDLYEPVTAIVARLAEAGFASGAIYNILEQAVEFVLLHTESAPPLISGGTEEKS